MRLFFRVSQVVTSDYCSSSTELNPGRKCLKWQTFPPLLWFQIIRSQKKVGVHFSSSDVPLLWGLVWAGSRLSLYQWSNRLIWYPTNDLIQCRRCNAYCSTRDFLRYRSAPHFYEAPCSLEELHAAPKDSLREIWRCNAIINYPIWPKVHQAGKERRIYSICYENDTDEFGYYCCRLKKPLSWGAPLIRNISTKTGLLPLS